MCCIHQFCIVLYTVYCFVQCYHLQVFQVPISLYNIWRRGSIMSVYCDWAVTERIWYSFVPGSHLSGARREISIVMTLLGADTPHFLYAPARGSVEIVRYRVCSLTPRVLWLHTDWIHFYQVTEQTKNDDQKKIHEAKSQPQELQLHPSDLPIPISDSKGRHGGLHPDSADLTPVCIVWLTAGFLG